MKRTAIALLCIALGQSAAAQSTDKPMRIILPVSAGSGVDAATRAMSNALAKQLGQPVVIENVPGAGSVTGTQQIVKAPKDGNTIGVVSNNHVINPAVYKSMPYHAVDDITPIMVLGALPLALVAHPSVPAKNIPELIALAKAKPASLNYGSAGNGTILHLAGEMLVREAGVQITHIPYRGTGQLMTDLVGGQIQLGFVAISVATQQIKSGGLRGLGVSTVARSSLTPELPTIAEQGLPNYGIDAWLGVIGPAGLPSAEVSRINGAFKRTLETPEVRANLINSQGYTLRGSTADEALAYFRSEVERMAKLVKEAGVKVD